MKIGRNPASGNSDGKLIPGAKTVTVAHGGMAPPRRDGE